MADVEVRREDQVQINEFGRLNAKLHEKRDDRALLQKMIEELEDGSTELALNEDDNVKLMLGGESFIDVTEDYATEYVDRETERLQKDLEAIDDVIATITSRQKDLKAILYARFGTDINLEEK